jgi:hypothetical protein
MQNYNYSTKIAAFCFDFFLFSYFSCSGENEKQFERKAYAVSTQKRLRKLFVLNYATVIS